MDKYRKFTATEKKWINSFEKIMKSAPKSLFLFVGEGIYVYPLSPDDERYMNQFGGVDGNCPHISVQTDIHYDGGAY